jgi:NADPH:quinone reductase-like Zn-dependent oxidoreductase
MKAAVYRSYGPPDVLKVVDIESPTIQIGHDDCLLIGVSHASVNPYDILHREENRLASPDLEPRTST